ncbi:MAG TPA: hypothetical protein VGF65_00020 [Mycobacterium sp.]|jgi:chaperonin cofactor prefoldin
MSNLSTETAMVRELRKRIEIMEIHIKALETENAALERHNVELRAAVAALLDPAPVKKADTHGVWLPPVTT